MIQTDKIINLYIRTRDEVSALEDAHKAALAPLKERLQKLEGALHKIMLDRGETSIKTEHGTAYHAEWAAAKVEDFDALFWWAAKHNRPDLLTKAVNKTALMEIGEDQVPGVTVTRGIKTNVRRR